MNKFLNKKRKKIIPIKLSINLTNSFDLNSNLSNFNSNKNTPKYNNNNN